jgi:hypothetical protein
VPTAHELAKTAEDDALIGLAELPLKMARPSPPPPPSRPTPQVTVEAILVAVRERGLAALEEPATLERLARCDAAAVQELTKRITKIFVEEES